MDTEEEIRELPVKEWPGWTKIQIGKNTRRYRSPGGVEISAARYYELATKYKGQTHIPESDVIKTSNSSPKGFFGSNSAKKSPDVTKSKKDESIFQDEDNVLNLPDPVIKPGRGSGGRASSKELQASLQTTLVIATSILSLILDLPDINMTEVEAKSISIPAANIFESTSLNEKFGRMFANSGDYQLLGYALYLYVHRVANAFIEKRNMYVKPTGSPSNAPKQQESKPTEPVQFRGANLPYSSSGARWLTPSIING